MKERIFALILLLLAVPCQGRTITVDDDGPADFSNIQAAINDASNSDTIVVAEGTYMGPGNRDISFQSKAITVRSTDPDDSNIVANTIIDCENTYRGFCFSGLEGANTILDGFTITRAWASSKGAAIYSGFANNHYAQAVIRHCKITDCNTSSGGTGGVIYGWDGLIEDCAFENNHRIILCGGTLKNSIIRFNTYQPLYSDGEVINCVIADNAYAVGGQGITIENSTISNNGPHGISTNGPATIKNSIIWGHSTDIYQNCTKDSQCGALIVEFSIFGTLWTNLQDFLQVNSCINTDPCFADPCGGDFHLKSQAGRWDPNLNDWLYDSTTSPGIDTGNPGCSLGEEPNSIKNVRINMGAYGGTAQASKTPIGRGMLADLNNDRVVDLNDLALFAQYWLENVEYVPSDLSRNAFVDLIDFSFFSDCWQNCTRSTETDFVIEKQTLSDYYTPDNNAVEPNSPGYTLPLDMNNVWNIDDLEWWLPMPDITPTIEQNGFAIVENFTFPYAGVWPPSDIRQGFTTFYDYLRRMYMYLFITSDTLLHLYHVQFDETLKEIEENEFIPDINDLTKSLLNLSVNQYNSLTGDLQEAAKRNIAYLAVANKLIDPNAAVPAFVADTVTSELAKIEAHAGFADSDIFIYNEDYSQYVPRGHYTRSDELKCYFKTLMWYGRMAFLLKGSDNWGPYPWNDALISIYDAKIQTMQAILLADSIENSQVDQRTGREIWDRMYIVTAFYVGLADDLTPYEYIAVIKQLFCGGLDLTYLSDADTLFELKANLSLLRSPAINGGTGNIWLMPPYSAGQLDELLNKTKGMRFMGQRFIPDSYMFQQLVFPTVTYYTGDGDPIPFTLAQTGDGSVSRGYPRGMDVMSILGSARADAILLEEGDTEYVNYSSQYSMLRDTFNAFDVNDWNRNLYWGWLYALRSLVDGFGDGYPNFMREQGWEKKELNAALASWTELRHNTILYAKQSYTPPGKGGVPPPPSATGYVEPVPEFYRRLLALTNMTQQGLNDLNALSPQADTRLTNMKNILSQLAQIADKELTNQELSVDDYNYIGNFAKTLEQAITGVSTTGIKTLLVADVHTHSFEEKVVEEGVGYVDLIIVACQLPNGSIILATGPVMSYYEFKWPMNDRLTDEAWKNLLDSASKPARPLWIQQLVH
jgi:hypothetical protein